MTDFNEEIRKSLQQFQGRLIEDAAFGDKGKYSPFVSTGQMHPSIRSTPISMRPLRVITSPHVLETAKCSRERSEGFWAKVWRDFWDHNPWPYSLIEYYEVEKPAIMFDRGNNCVICHPSIEQEIRKAVREGALR